MIKRISAGVLPFVLLGVQSVYGETFSLNQTYSIALQKNEEVQIAREGIRQSEEEKQRAFSAVMPKVTLSGTYNRYPEKSRDLGNSTVILQPEHSYGIEVTLEQPLYAGGKGAAGIRIAKRGIEVAKKNHDLSIESMLFHVAEVYYGRLEAQKSLESQQRNVERLQEHRRLSELRYKVGEVTQSVLLRAQAELARAQADRVALENDAAVKKRELDILSGLPDDAEISEPSVPKIPGETGSGLLTAALDSREDVHRSRLQEEIAKEGVVFARGNFLPSLSLDGTYFSRNQDPRSTFFIDQGWVIGAKLEFPVFEGGLRRAEMAQARSRLESGRLETARLKKRVDLEVTQASLNLEAATRVLQSREEQVRFADENYEMVSKQFTFGSSTHIDLLDANQTLIEAERDVIGATYTRHLAILNLQRKIGIFLSGVLEETQKNM
ncbi:MAG: TolC family protein [Nitrospirota bacterium]